MILLQQQQQQQERAMVDQSCEVTQITRDVAAAEMAPMTSKFMALWQQRSVEAYIAANLHTTIRMAELAKVAQCTRSRFHRSFKRSFGCTPHQYVIRRRIARTQRLMTISNESLIQISAKCGFVDQFHLRNMFRRVVGQPPGAWRRIHARPVRAEFPHSGPPPGLKSSVLSESANRVARNISESPSSFV
ncbi:MAG TPA: AraC family transcriptional regulator [Steroidobacteraceae bacterium]